MTQHAPERRKLLLVTTVPDTLAYILRDQPRYLNRFFDVTLVSCDDGRLSALAEKEGVVAIGVPMERGIAPLRDLRSLYRMICVLRQIRPAIIHSYTPKAGLVSMLAARICRIPIRVHTFTGLIFPTQQGLMQRLLIAIDRMICRCATTVVPESQGVLKDLRAYRITAKPMAMIGYGNIAGVDTHHFSRQETEKLALTGQLREKLANARLVYCFVGRIHRDKGIRELVTAFCRLPPNCILLLVGEDDPQAPVDAETRAAIAEHANICTLGFMDDVRPALACADVLVLPSYREGFPNVVLQAGAMELPVIASDISGCNEAISPGWNGWLVPPRDVEALETAMRQALESSAEQLRALGENARKRVKERYERTDHLQRMRDFYGERV